MNGERDSTQEWLLPPGAGPPSVRELELRIERALAIARSSEAAVCQIGDVALEAARQAGRAAELAERASAAAQAANREAIERRHEARVAVAAAPAANGSGGNGSTPGGNGAAGGANGTSSAAPARPGGAPPVDCLARFSARADRVAARFRALQPA